jgi:hypothetical protein
MVAKLESGSAMTFRDLIHAVMDTGNWNKVTSIIYDTYYTENDSRAAVDSSYMSALAELIELPHDKQQTQIVLEQATTLIPGRDDDTTIEKYISVRLQEPDEGACSTSYVEWTELIDMTIVDETDSNMNEQLAHIMYEITFHGFSNESVKQAAAELVRQIEEVEKCPDKLIDWEDVTRDFHD